MDNLNYLGIGQTLSYQQVWLADNLKSCQAILDVVDELSDKILFKSGCRVKDVTHYHIYKTQIQQIIAKINSKEGEVPGSSLIKTEGSRNLYDYSYAQLKSIIENSEGNILSATIEDHDCPTTIVCTDCKGTCICSECKGKKRITCPVCDGSKECPSCNSSGRYPCHHCDETGTCPECGGDGTVYCDECNGSGHVECWTCNDSGRCPDCCGSGIFHTGSRAVKCRRCNGTGKCSSCKGGKKPFTCRNCDGDGYLICDECNGKGSCNRCHGKGSFTCHACKGTGKCGKCHGNGKINCPTCKASGKCSLCSGTGELTCPRCDGLGKYQTYNKIIINESEKMEFHTSLDCDIQKIEEVQGAVLYEGTAYDLFMKVVNVYNVDLSYDGLDNDYQQKYKVWLDLNRWAKVESVSRNVLTDDFIHINVKNERVQVTEVKMIAGSDTFIIYVMGTNNIIFYDHLPSIANRIWGYIKSIFNN